MRAVTWIGLLLVTMLTGCTYEREGPVSQHYVEFKTQPPRGNTVYVCHAYGCKMQTKVRITETDIATLRDVMKKMRNSDDAKGERRAVAYAIAWMENRVGKEIGTDKDRPGMDFNASGDPTQQDCVDEATQWASKIPHDHAADVQGEPPARRRRLAALDGGADRENQQPALGGR